MRRASTLAGASYGIGDCTSILEDTYTLFTREMLIFKKNLGVSIIRSVIFPVIFIVLLGSIGNAPRNVPIAVVNYDNGLSSRSFINQLEAGGELNVVSATNQQAAMSLLAEGSVVAVVVIPSGFPIEAQGAPNIFVYTDVSSSVSAEVASSVIASVASRFGVAPKTSIPQGLVVSTNPAYGATSNTASFTVAGILVMVAIFGAVFGGGFTVLSDRELGNLKAFMITPVSKFSVLLSKVMYGTVQSLISAYIALGIGILYGARITSGLGGLIEILWFVGLAGFGFSALAIAMAARTKQTQTYGILSQTITLPLSFLGGAFVPVSSLPAILYPITVVNPVTYAVNAVRDVMLKGYLPLTAFFTDSAILIAFALVTLAIAVVLFKGANE